METITQELSTAEQMSNAHAFVRPEDEVTADIMGTLKHGLVQALLLARRDEAGRSEPLDSFDRKWLAGVAMRAFNMADVDVLTDVASDSAGRTATDCWKEQITDPRVIARRAVADFLEAIAEQR